jgi:hypothetical protein
MDMHSNTTPITKSCRPRVTVVFFIALCLVAILMVTGCSRLFPKRSPKVRTLPVPKLSDEGIKLERRLSVDGVAVNMDYDHPHEFSEEMIRDEMGLLVVRQYKAGKDNGASTWVSEPAFTEAATERLAPALVVAFKEACRSDKILFRVLGRTGRPTLGEVYLEDDELVWIFKEIDGRTFLGSDPLTLEAGDWTIEKKPYLCVHNSKNAGIIKVVCNLREKSGTLAEPTAKQPLPQPEALSMEAREAVVAPGAMVSTRPDNLREAKLRTLKKWKDTGLITDEDYEREKARILEQRQQL